MALEDAKTRVDDAFTRSDLRGLSFENTFGGATSFLRRRYTKDLAGVDIAVTGVPFDQAVTNRPGTRLGPRAIREASALQAVDPPYGWPFNVLEDCAIADYGDLAFDYANVRARAEKHGPLSLIHFDAHADTWPDDDMARVDHGTMFYKAVKSGLVDPARSVQIGIRTTNADTLGVHIIDAPEVHLIGAEEVVARVHQIVGDHPAYLSFDIDALDPAYAPGTGTPVWGGLTSAQAAAMLRGLAGVNLKGGDVVEVSPPFDTTGATAIAGAHVAVEICCLLGWALRA